MEDNQVPQVCFIKDAIAEEDIMLEFTARQGGVPPQAS